MIKQNEYKTFITFTRRGRKFLGLETGHHMEIYNDKMEFYGCFFGRESFETMYEESGENLNCTTAAKITEEK